MGEVLTSEREVASVASDQVVPEPRKPEVETFREIVSRHCKKWSATTVEDLCTAQTQDLIDELAEHFG